MEGKFDNCGIWFVGVVIDHQNHRSASMYPTHTMQKYLRIDCGIFLHPSVSALPRPTPTEVRKLLMVRGNCLGSINPYASQMACRPDHVKLASRFDACELILHCYMVQLVYPKQVLAMQHRFDNARHDENAIVAPYYP